MWFIQPGFHMMYYGKLLHYSCMGNPMDRGAWHATVHGVTKSRTRLSDWTELNWTHVRDPGKLSNLPNWTKISSSTQPSAKNKRGSWGWGGYQEKHRNQGWCWCRFKSWSSQLIRISGDLVILFFLVQRGSCYSVAQLCPTLWNPMDCSMPGSSIHGISQARILEWVAISPFRGSSKPRDRSGIPCLEGGLFTTEPLGKPTERKISLQTEVFLTWFSESFPHWLLLRK